MHEDYCFRCGAWARIEDVSKLCRPCYEAWPYDKRPDDKHPDQGDVKS